LQFEDTTRRPRTGELNGVAYHFVDREAFLDLVNQGGFIEYTESYGNLSEVLQRHPWLHTDLGRIVAKIWNIRDGC
jgi:guanylate kinase